MLQSELLAILLPCQEDGNRGISVKNEYLDQYDCSRIRSSGYLRNLQRNLPRNAASKHTTLFLTAILATLENNVPFLITLLLQSGVEIHEKRSQETAFPYDVGDGGFLPWNAFRGRVRMGEEISPVSCTL